MENFKKWKLGNKIALAALLIALVAFVEQSYFSFSKKSQNPQVLHNNYTNKIRSSVDNSVTQFVSNISNPIIEKTKETEKIVNKSKLEKKRDEIINTSEKKTLKPDKPSETKIINRTMNLNREEALEFSSIGFSATNIGKSGTVENMHPMLMLKLPYHDKKYTLVINKFSTSFEIDGREFMFKVLDFNENTIVVSLKES